MQHEIAQAIQKAVQQRVTANVEAFVKKEVLQQLKSRNIVTRNSSRERNNRETILVESDNLQRKIGSLVTQRVGERLRFKLKGIQSRDPKDEIDMAALTVNIKKAVTEAIRLGKLRVLK